MTNRPHRALFDPAPLISPEQAAADAEWVRQHVADGTLRAATKRRSKTEQAVLRERGYRLLDEGHKAQDVAASLRVSPKTVYNWINDRAERPPGIDRAKELRDQGWTDSRIADELKISRQTIRKYLGPSPHHKFERTSELREKHIAQVRQLREHGGATPGFPSRSESTGRHSGSG